MGESEVTGMSTTGATEILIGIIPFGLDADAVDSLSGTVNLAWSLCSAFNETADPSLVTKKTRRNVTAQAKLANIPELNLECVSGCSKCPSTVEDEKDVGMVSQSSGQFQKQSLQFVGSV